MSEYSHALQVCTSFNKHCQGCPIGSLCVGTTIDTIMHRLRIMDDLAKDYIQRKETKKMEVVK